MVRKTKSKRKSLKTRREATLKKTRLNFQLVSAEFIEAEIILEDCIQEFNDRFETGREQKIVEPKVVEESDATDMVETDIEVEEEKEEEPVEEEAQEEEEETQPLVEEVDDEVLNRDKDLKDLFKRIALKTHPDRLQDDDNVEYKTELYKEAASAVKSGDGMTLLEIAYELDIKVDIDPAKELEWLNGKIRRIQHNIQEIQNTAEWIWYHSDGAERQRIEFMVKNQLGFKIRSSSDDKTDV